MTTHEALAPESAPSFRGPRAFRLVRRLSSSPMAEVYEAEDGRGDEVVLKIRAARSKGASGDRRVLREAAALASIRHLNVVPVLDAGFADDGRAFFVMPKLRGPSLRALLSREGRLAPRRAVSLVAGVLDGLAAAHQEGIVHRDIKPDNVIVHAGLGGRERAILIDFGLAEQEGASNDGGESEVEGSPAYLAPELIAGEPADARSDVYAVATMLFEAITGRHPFDARGPFERMRAHVDDEPLRLRDHAVVPAELDEAISRALAKDPEQRFATAEAFARALRRAFEPKPSLATPARLPLPVLQAS